MKAEDLKRWPLLFKKFKKNIKKFSACYSNYGEYIQDQDTLTAAFGWSASKQGLSFWEALHEDDIETAKTLQPKLFSIDNQVVEDYRGVSLSDYLIEYGKDCTHFEHEHFSLEELKTTMEELEYHYNTTRGMGCSIIACYHSDGSGKLVRCDAGGNNPIVIMWWGRKYE